MQGVRRAADADSLLAVARDRGCGERVTPVIVDVRSDEDVARAHATVGGTLRAMSPRRSLCCVVNNAARGPSMLPLEQTTVAAVRDTLDVNVLGPTRVLHAMLPLLREHGAGARVINVGSVLGIYAMPSQAAYSASKHALEGLVRVFACLDALRGLLFAGCLCLSLCLYLSARCIGPCAALSLSTLTLPSMLQTDSLRVELHGMDIGVSLVMPGVTDTPMMERGLDGTVDSTASPDYRAVSGLPPTVSDLYRLLSINARRELRDLAAKKMVSSPHDAAVAIERVLTSSSPPARVTVGPGAAIVYNVMRYLPYPVIDAATRSSAMQPLPADKA
jgi:NAD(P)-dependent dehydrogenase (short-subunit alcohol dehydrogenase family)